MNEELNTVEDAPETDAPVEESYQAKVRRIFLHGSSKLRETADPVQFVDGTVVDETQQLIADLFKTMDDTHGMGLAATQIGVQQRVFVLQIPSLGRMAFLNPSWTPVDEEKETDTEGCLSFPGVLVSVPRYCTITAQFVDEDGKFQQEQLGGLAARAFQHESDHLVGRTMIDDLSKLKQNIALRRLKKIKKRYGLK